MPISDPIRPALAGHGHQSYLREGKSYVDAVYEATPPTQRRLPGMAGIFYASKIISTRHDDTEGLTMLPDNACFLSVIGAKPMLATLRHQPHV